jgi:hypothetical protein
MDALAEARGRENGGHAEAYADLRGEGGTYCQD